jgi:hypothetical protein
MLANISELDREAAEIVQKEQAREQALLAAEDAKFYAYPDVPAVGNENVEVPKRSSARELISLFNAIGNVTKVTVNSTFFSKEGSNFFSREGIEKRFSFMRESVHATEQRVVVGGSTFQQQGMSQSFVTDCKTSLASSPVVGKCKESADSTRITGTSDVSGVAIEEVEDDLEKSSRSRVMYEANKSRRHHSPSPSIPTIAEQSESTSSVATTPASTLDLYGGNHESDNIPMTNPIPDALQHAKRMTIWNCPRCTLENPRWKVTCDACGRWRPPVLDEKPDSSKCEEPFQRPTSPLLDTKKPVTNKVQIIKMELSKKGKGIDWEEELKRYLPHNESQADKKDERKEHLFKEPYEDKGLGVQNSAEFSDFSVLIDSSTHSQSGAVLENNTGKMKSEELQADKNKAMTSPSVSVGDLNQDQGKPVNKTVEVSSDSVMVNGAEPLMEKLDVDEVRKARLAFFSRTSEMNDQVISNSKNSTATPLEQEVHGEVNSELVTVKKVVDESEQLKLREMLKEMKNSLPKRPKDSAIIVGKNTNLGGANSVMSNEQCSMEGKSVNDAHKLGAIKKIPQKVSKHERRTINNASGSDSEKGGKFRLQNSIENENKQVEAVFVTTKTVYEDIKVKKTGKPPKVSTSVQTNSIVRRVEGEQGENLKSSYMVPVTVEEFSATGIKDGVLYTSLNKESRRIGKGTFELIRARDFANIEATKISGESSAVHVYANVPPSSPPEQNPHFLSGCVTQHVFTAQQPSPTLVHKPSENERDVTETIRSPQTEAKNSEEFRGVALFEESSHFTSNVTSADSDSKQRGPLQPSRATSEICSGSLASVSSGNCSEVERLTAQLTLPKGIADFKGWSKSVVKSLIRKWIYALITVCACLHAHLPFK